MKRTRPRVLPARRGRRACRTQAEGPARAGTRVPPRNVPRPRCFDGSESPAPPGWHCPGEPLNPAPPDPPLRCAATAHPLGTPPREGLTGSTRPRRTANPGIRFHVKQGHQRTRSRADRHTCRRHAPVIPARFGWSVRTRQPGHSRCLAEVSPGRRGRPREDPSPPAPTLSTRGQPTAHGRGRSMLGSQPAGLHPH